MKPDTLNLIEKKVGNSLELIGTEEKKSFCRTLLSQVLRSADSKRDLMKLRGFCMAKDTIIQTKWQSSKWEKIFTNPTSDRALIFKIYKTFKKQNFKKTNNPV